MIDRLEQGCKCLLKLGLERLKAIYQACMLTAKYHSAAVLPKDQEPLQ